MHINTYTLNFVTARVQVIYIQPPMGSEPRASQAHVTWGHFLHKNTPERKCPKNSVPSKLGTRGTNSTLPSHLAS